jgi:hypothetical protein
MEKHQTEKHHHVYCENKKLHMMDNQKNSRLFLKSNNDSDCDGPSKRFGDTEDAALLNIQASKKLLKSWHVWSKSARHHHFCC